MVCIRGAITIEKNTEEDIINNTMLLLNKIIENNKLERIKIISIFFSCTSDINAAYPAKAARIIGLNDVALMCFQEMHVEGSLPMCIRVCIFYDDKIEKLDIKHTYLKGAAVLRPDLINTNFNSCF